MASHGSHGQLCPTCPSTFHASSRCQASCDKPRKSAILPPLNKGATKGPGHWDSIFVPGRIRTLLPSLPQGQGVETDQGHP